MKYFLDQSQGAWQTSVSPSSEAALYHSARDIMLRDTQIRVQAGADHEVHSSRQEGLHRGNWTTHVSEGAQDWVPQSTCWTL